MPHLLPANGPDDRTEPLPSCEFGAIRVLDGGRAFRVECRDGTGRRIDLDVPAEALHRLMRELPRVEAALLEARAEPSGAIAARPVVGWGVDGIGAGRGVALCLCTEGGVESAVAFGIAEAHAFHREFGAALKAESAVVTSAQSALAARTDAVS